MTKLSERLLELMPATQDMESTEKCSTLQEAADVIDGLAVALEQLTARTKPIADMVYNDNGDMTVTGHVTFDQITNIYWADKRAREALKALKGEQQ